MAKVLIVDDKEENRYVLNNFFKLFGIDSGIELSEATTGKEAVTKVTSEKPDLVLMDIKMETDDAGLEAVKAIRQDSSVNQIPIWAITSQAMDAHDGEESDRVKCLNAGCDHYITKPIDQVELLLKVSKQLNITIPEKTKMRMGVE
jgi:CheY-like chemotaxis protein